MTDDDCDIRLTWLCVQLLLVSSIMGAVYNAGLENDRAERRAGKRQDPAKSLLGLFAVSCRFPSPAVYSVMR